MKILLVYNTMEYVWLRKRFIEDLQGRGHSIFAIAPFDGWEERVRQLGVECLHVPMSRWGANPLREIRTLFALARAFARVRADATFLYTIKPVIYGSIVARVLSLRRVFVLVVGGALVGFVLKGNRARDRVRRAFASALYKAVLRPAEKVFFQNSDDLRVFADAKIVRKDQIVRVHGSGVDTAHFVPLPEPDESGSFILVSRMLWNKGIGLYVEAARNLKQRFPKAKFLLVGAPDDNPASIPLDQLTAWHEEGVIEYCGYVEDIRTLLGQALVYVLPSHYREGIPRTNLEALAMGKAIITTDTPGCRETVVDGANGILVPARDRPALEAAMETFLRDPELARKMGGASRQLAEERFDQSTVNKVFIDVIDGTLSSESIYTSPGSRDEKLRPGEAR